MGTKNRISGVARRVLITHDIRQSQLSSLSHPHMVTTMSTMVAQFSPSSPTSVLYFVFTFSYFRSPLTKFSQVLLF